MTLVPAPPRWHLARTNRRRLRHCQTQNLHRRPRSMLTTPAIGGRATVRIPTPSRSNPHSAVARLPHHGSVPTRGFLPCRLSDAGPRARGTIREGPASETLHKRGTPSTHPIQGDEIRALRRLKREAPHSEFVFLSERGGPFSTAGFARLVERAGKEAGLPFKAHPHMARHACGYKLANDGVDTRSLQAYLGHRNIQHVCRCTELAVNRFDNFWK